MTQRIALALLVLLGAAVAGPPEYQFIPLPRFHPSRSSQAVDIKALGRDAEARGHLEEARKLAAAGKPTDEQRRILKEAEAALR